ncbi:MAG TPA: tetrahydrofolate dehydrogenase/cyclohydrolase catalytic domain-containing protein [Deinococcales bacterium]|nr:tetrahydrofolate dehydrogenase/cyclohydrolase catalytic domain-containing protein [Deinococcales bacterium]
MSNPTLQARSLPGDAVANAVLERAREIMATLPVTPHLHVVRVGEDPASVSYVKTKANRAKRIGLESTVHALPDDTSEGDLLELVRRLSLDEEAHGMLVQLPFPPGSSIRKERVLEAIHPDKDVDGLTAVNIGRLWSDEPGLRPCTPAGVISLLDHYGVELKGRRAVIIGRSNLVGKPLAALMLARHATVTLAHSRTQDLAAVAREADVLVAAVGKAGVVTRDMVRPGATVIDVGINRVDGQIVGDVSPDVAEVAGALTPVPGGVGLLTVAHLLLNTVLAARQQTLGLPPAL